MPEENTAQLYTSPGGKFIRSDSLPRTLAHWRSIRTNKTRSHFVKYEGEHCANEQVDKLQLLYL